MENQGPVAFPVGPQNAVVSRPRATNTCRECRRRKVRCDRKRPACTRCMEHRPNLPCIYDNSESRPRTYHFLSGTTTTSSSFEPSMPVTGASLPQTSGEDVEAILPDRLISIEERLGQLNRMVESLRDAQQTESSTRRSSPPFVAGNVPRSEDFRGLSTNTASASSDLHRPLGYLDVPSPGRTRYVSRTFWASMCNEVSELQSLLRAQTRAEPTASIGDMDSHTVADNAMFELVPSSSQTQTDRPGREVTSEPWLPSKATADMLFEAFIYDVYPVMPLVHVPSFNREYQRFWELGPTVANQLKSSSAPLILAALYAGAVACTGTSFHEAFSDDERDEVVHRLHVVASLALRKSGFPQIPSVESLSAYMMLQGTRMVEEEPLSNCGFVGVVVRVAQMLGLNRDPSHFGTQLSAIMAEVRRRVWWHAYHLDVSIAVASGLPSMITDGSWEVRQPSELSDEHIGTIAGKMYEDDVQAGRRMPNDCNSQGTLVSPVGIWLQGKMENAVVTRKLLDMALNGYQMTLDTVAITQKYLAELTDNMSRRITRLPAASESNAYNNNFSFNTWAKIMLSAMGEQHWWFLCTSVPSHANSRMVEDAHTRVVDRSCKFLQKMSCLSACEMFARYYWAWPGNHQPLHVIMTLIREVATLSDTYSSSSIRYVVDQAIALCGPQGGLTGSRGEGVVPRPLTAAGQEAWEVILRQRERAWTKVGADINIPTRKESRSNAEDTLRSIMEIMASGTENQSDEPIPLDLDPFGFTWRGWSPLYSMD